MAACSTRSTRTIGDTRKQLHGCIAKLLNRDRTPVRLFLKSSDSRLSAKASPTAPQNSPSPGAELLGASPKPLSPGARLFFESKNAPSPLKMTFSEPQNGRSPGAMTFWESKNCRSRVATTFLESKKRRTTVATGFFESKNRRSPGDTSLKPPQNRVYIGAKGFWDIEKRPRTGENRTFRPF